MLNKIIPALDASETKDMCTVFDDGLVFQRNVLEANDARSSIICGGWIVFLRWCHGCLGYIIGYRFVVIKNTGRVRKKSYIKVILIYKMYRSFACCVEVVETYNTVLCVSRVLMRRIFRPRVWPKIRLSEFLLKYLFWSSSHFWRELAFLSANWPNKEQ